MKFDVKKDTLVVTFQVIVLNIFFTRMCEKTRFLYLACIFTTSYRKSHFLLVTFKDDSIVRHSIIYHILTYSLGIFFHVHIVK